MFTFVDLAHFFLLQSVSTLAAADVTSTEAEATRVRAEDLEAQLNATLDAIRGEIIVNVCQGKLWDL